MSTTVPISIYNTGAVTYSWMFAEQNLGDDVSGAPGVIPYLSEDFESWPPAGWYITESITSSTTSCMWESTATTGRANYTGGTGNAADADSDWCGEAMDTEMWTPPIDLSGASAPSLSFWTQFWVWGDDHAYVDISTDGGANWTNLLHYTSDVNGPHQETIDLSAYAGEPSVIIRFRYTAAGWDWFWEVDDVLVAEVDPVTWMSEDPTSGEALPDTGESNAAVTLDAGVPEITQPGDYVAILQVTDGTYEMNVPVTLTVNPDPTWGELSGVVYSLGACDVNTATLEGADVTIANISGTIAALTTGADGAYSYWLPPDTYTVTVAEGDHVADSAVVTITASGATQDFYLHWVGPCFSDLNPKAIEVTINMGMTDTVPVTLTNSGLGDMNWSVGLLPLLSEDFEGAFPPAGWTVYDNAGTGMMWHRNDYFGVGNQAAFGSGYSAAAHAYLSGAAWDTELWSPPVFLPGDTILTYASNFQDYAGNGDMWLDISTDGGATWTNLRYQTTDDPFGGTFETEDLSAYTGQTVILRWRYSATSSTAWFWHIDDVKLTMVVPWLSVAPDAGTAAAGSDSTTNVGFDAGQVDAPGDYYATLLVETDDPSHPQATIPVTMHVTLPSDWAYVTGDVFGVNGCGQDPMPLEGAQVVLVPLGSAALPVTFTTTTDASGSYSYWLDEAWGPLNIFVTYPGYEDGEMYGVVITGSATTTANFTLRALEPCAGVEPSGISAVVELGMTDTVPFSITNTGAFTLTWELEEESGYEFVPAWAQHTPQMYVVGEDKAADASTGESAGPDLSGGPDPFGYTFMDSNEPGGPAYDWVEIAPPEGGSGASSGLAGIDDGYAWPIDLPFAFNFYGTDYTQLAFGSNGTVYFEDDYLGLGNTVIPGSNSYGVYTFIAPFWDDLVVDGDVYYQYDGSRFIIEFYHVRRYGTPDYGTWEVILYPNGSILMQYQDVSFGSASYDYGGSATVGIQGDTATGLQYSYNTASLSDGLAICFAYPGAGCGAGGGAGIPWLTEVPTNGVTGPDSAFVVDAVFDAGVPEVEQPGEYYGVLRLNSDDPISDSMAIPVTMTVVAPDNWAHVQGTVMGVDGCGQNPVPLEGAQVLLVAQGSAGLPFTLTTDVNGTFSYWLDEAWGPLNIYVTYPGYEDGEMLGVVITGSETITADFTLREPNPCVSVTPAGIAVTLVQGESEDYALALGNSGLLTATAQFFEENVGFTPQRPTAAGGPDGFGYRYADSNEPNGPQYNFVDISDFGTPLALGDDDFAELEIGFGFRFYENTYDSVFVGSNGLFSFGSGSTDLSPDNIPDPALPNNIIASMWSDLQPGTVYYQFFDDCPYNQGVSSSACFVVQYDGFEFADGSQAGTWEVILFRTGNILMQFADVGDTHGVGTGIEDELGLDGLNYVPIPADDTAVCFAFPGEDTDCQTVDIPWLSLSDDEVEALPSGSAAVTVTLDAGVPEVYEPGVYQGQILIATNDPLHPNFVVPVTMTVNRAAGKLAGTVVGWGHCDATSETLSAVEIWIEGADGSLWNAVTDANGDYSIWLDEGSNPYTLTVAAPGYVEEVRGGVEVNNDGSTTTADFDLSLDAPCVELTPGEIADTMRAGETLTHTLTLANNGAGELVYTDIIADSPWMSVSPSSGTVPPHSSQNLTLTLDATGLQGGRHYYGVLKVMHNDEVVGELYVPVNVSLGNSIYLPLVMRNY